MTDSPLILGLLHKLRIILLFSLKVNVTTQRIWGNAASSADDAVKLRRQKNNLKKTKCQTHWRKVCLSIFLIVLHSHKCAIKIQAGENWIVCHMLTKALRALKDSKHSSLRHSWAHFPPGAGDWMRSLNYNAPPPLSPQPSVLSQASTSSRHACGSPPVLSSWSNFWAVRWF